MPRTSDGGLGEVDHNLGNVGASAPCYCRETTVYKYRQYQAFAVRFLLQRAAQRLRDRSLFFVFSIHYDATGPTLKLDDYQAFGKQITSFQRRLPPFRFSPKCGFPPMIRHFDGHLDDIRHIVASRTMRPEDHDYLVVCS